MGSLLQNPKLLLLCNAALHISKSCYGTDKMLVKAFHKHRAINISKKINANTYWQVAYSDKKLDIVETRRTEIKSDDPLFTAECSCKKNQSNFLK